MANAIERLKVIYAELENLKESIRKLGPVKRDEPLGQLKYSAVEKLYEEFLSIFENETLLLELEKLDKKEVDILENLGKQIRKIYDKIYSYERGNTNRTTMAKFDLKTAVNLIPVMDGSEDMTKRMIDSIDLYSSMIDATEQNLLINFVLKTRLTESAKLRLEKSYTSCKSLIDDIRKHLLTKKSSTALHSQLLKSSQGSRSIEEYGKSLEELFVQLTVSQADGDTSAYNVLKPLNEKLAVQRFADGLRNKNLSLILTARNYDTLKDVIQAAKDEELSSFCSEPRESMFYARRGFSRGNFTRGRYVHNQQSRGGATHRNNYNNNYTCPPRASFGQNLRGFHHSRPGNFRGRRPVSSYKPNGGQYNRYRGPPNRGHNLHYMEGQDQGHSSVPYDDARNVNEQNSTSNNQFFRV